jgi:hypothetical protein
MPTSKELTLRMADRPGTLGKICGALAARGVNILAFQSFPLQGESQVRLVVSDPAAAKDVLNNQKVSYTETDVAQVKLPNRPGGLANAASQLGNANININYAYCGIDPNTNSPLLIFGVNEVAQATKILDQAAIAA